MIYYLLLIVADILFGAQFMIVNGYQKRNGDKIRSSLVLSMSEGIFAFIIFFIISKFKLNITLYSFLMALLLSFVCMACTIVGIKTLSLGSVAIYTLFIMAGGMVVPFLAGAIFLNEEVTALKIVGITLMLFMLFIPLFSKEKNMKKVSKKDTVLFYVCSSFLFLLNGLNSAITKFHQVNPNAMNSTEFTSLLFLVTAVMAFIFYAIFSLKEKKEDEKQNIEYVPLINKTALLFGFLFALVNGTASFLNILCAKSVDATAQFPIITGGTIFVSLVLGRIIFKEKLTKIQIIQAIIAIISTILFIF